VPDWSDQCAVSGQSTGAECPTRILDLVLVLQL